MAHMDIVCHIFKNGLNGQFFDSISLIYHSCGFGIKEGIKKKKTWLIRASIQLYVTTGDELIHHFCYLSLLHACEVRCIPFLSQAEDPGKSSVC